ncbi:MAG TPA: hypothetical protein VMH89_01170 [Candidatus Acidoferrum sp.]|nr:hypothetical protein [Candidatus Acidoferrum sp.]
MSRILRALTVVLLFEMGALLLYLPWSSFWEQNYFLSHFPQLTQYVLNPALRGVVSGIGVLDILVAFGMFNPRSVPARVPPSTHP